MHQRQHLYILFLYAVLFLRIFDMVLLLLQYYITLPLQQSFCAFNRLLLLFFFLLWFFHSLFFIIACCAMVIFGYPRGCNIWGVFLRCCLLVLHNLCHTRKPVVAAKMHSDFFRLNYHYSFIAAISSFGCFLVGVLCIYVCRGLCVVKKCFDWFTWKNRREFLRYPVYISK